MKISWIENLKMEIENEKQPLLSNQQQAQNNQNDYTYPQNETGAETGKKINHKNGFFTKNNFLRVFRFFGNKSFSSSRLLDALWETLWIF